MQVIKFPKHEQGHRQAAASAKEKCDALFTELLEIKRAIAALQTRKRSILATLAATARRERGGVTGTLLLFVGARLALLGHVCRIGHAIATGSVF